MAQEQKGFRRRISTELVAIIASFILTVFTIGFTYGNLKTRLEAVEASSKANHEALVRHDNEMEKSEKRTDQILSEIEGVWNQVRSLLISAHVISKDAAPEELHMPASNHDDDPGRYATDYPKTHRTFRASKPMNAEKPKN
jgi:hypothetical protein